MLQRAAQVKKEGKKILIIVHAWSMVGYCLQIARDLNLDLAEKDFATSQQIARGWGRGSYYQMDSVFEDHSVWTLTPRGEMLRYSRNLRLITTS